MVRPIPDPRRRHAALALLAVAAAFAPAPPARAQAVDGTIATVAGTGVPGSAGDGGPAGQALVNAPGDVAYLADGSLVIADTANNKVRRVTTSGTILTAAGTGVSGSSGDGGPATDADLAAPAGVTALPGGGYLVADTANHRIRRVGPDGTITTIAGTTAGFGGDGGPAIAARLLRPTDTAVLPDGAILVADTGNHAVRRVAPDGTISTIAGTGVAGLDGDGGPAAAARLNAPRDVAVLTDGSLAIADTGNARVRRVDPGGSITTLAGTTSGLAGDGDPARDARLTAPGSVAPLPNGGVLVADTGNARVRRVTPLGAIIAVAGSTPGSSGDGGPAKSAQLGSPAGLTPAPGGGFVVADAASAVVRRVTGVGAIPPAVLRRSIVVAPRVGTPLVAPSGAPAALPLREQDIVPAGSAVDATVAKIAITAARDGAGTQQTAEIYDGPFAVTQLASPRGVTTDFRLPRLTGCAASGARAAADTERAFRLLATAAQKKKAKKKPRRRKRSRRIWVSDRGGNWRTSTGSTSASSIGTRWATTLLCDGTRVTVSEGRVRVRDRRRGRSVLLRAGQSIKIPTTGARRGI